MVKTTFTLKRAIQSCNQAVLAINVRLSPRALYNVTLAEDDVLAAKSRNERPCKTKTIYENTQGIASEIVFINTTVDAPALKCRVVTFALPAHYLLRGWQLSGRPTRADTRREQIPFCLLILVHYLKNSNTSCFSPLQRYPRLAKNQNFCRMRCD